jgi:hypothetical protein
MKSSACLSSNAVSVGLSDETISPGADISVVLSAAMPAADAGIRPAGKPGFLASFASAASPEAGATFGLPDTFSWRAF